VELAAQLAELVPRLEAVPALEQLSVQVHVVLAVVGTLERWGVVGLVVARLTAG
jgi:hypothetical protein